MLPFLLAAIPVARGIGGGRDVIDIAAGLLCIGFTVALALILGASVIGRDLSENRLSFYFSRPVGVASIWFGKVIGALALIVVSFAVILLPARVAGAARWAQAWAGNADQMALGILGAAIVLFFFAHVLGTFVRSRSAWIAFDFVAVIVAAVAGTWMIRSMFSAFAPTAGTRLSILVGAGVVIALIGGGAWQLARGRTDRRRSHRALSQFVWITIGTALIIASAYVGWLGSATPDDIRQLTVAVPRPGAWVILGGETRGRADYRTAFVYNLDSGAWTRIARPDLWRADLTPDGKTLVFVRVERNNTQTIFERPVEGGEARSTGLTLPLFTYYVTNATGSRIAAFDGQVLSVYDVPQKRTLAAAKLPQGVPRAMYFQSPTLVRIVIEHDVYELDAVRRTLHRVMELAGALISASADGSKFLVRDDQRRVLGTDGTTLGPGEDAMFLRDARIAVSIGPLVEIYKDGALARTIDLPSVITWRMRETRDGKLLVPGRVVGKHWETFIVDPDTGAVQRIPAAALTFQTWPRRDPRREPVDTPKYFFDDDRVVRWNYATQRGEPVVPKG